ncbi:MAG: GPW/gp25 family protein [Cyanobacteriota bacterium]|jgi:phage baseplate assembly protein W
MTFSSAITSSPTPPRSGSRLGQGWRFPPLLPPGFDWVRDADAVEQAIRILLITEPGERLRRPDYGVGLRRWLFSTNTAELRTQITRAIEEAIARHEPRIQLLEVAVTSDPAQPTLLRIALSYEIRAVPGPRNLVFPFDLREGQP